LPTPSSLAERPVLDGERLLPSDESDPTEVNFALLPSVTPPLGPPLTTRRAELVGGEEEEDSEEPRAVVGGRGRGWGLLIGI
jgi:hypothetical protein